MQASLLVDDIPCTRSIASFIIELSVVISKTKHLTIVLLCSVRAVTLRLDRFPPPGRFVVFGVTDTSSGTVLQVTMSSLLLVAQVNTTVWPALTFCDTGTSVTVAFTEMNSVFNTDNYTDIIIATIVYYIKDVFTLT